MALGLQDGQRASKDQDEPQPMRCYASTYPTEVESCADQSLLGVNLYSSPDFRNPTKNMRLNLAKDKHIQLMHLIPRNGGTSVPQKVG